LNPAQKLYTVCVRRVMLQHGRAGAASIAVSPEGIEFMNIAMPGLHIGSDIQPRHEREKT
jgi:hypothetical protein